MRSHAPTGMGGRAPRGRPRESTEGVDRFLLAERIRRRSKYTREKAREASVRSQMESVQNELASNLQVGAGSAGSAM